MVPHTDTFFCYLLYSDEILDHPSPPPPLEVCGGGPRTYIGYTNNLTKRIECHNGLRPGGAKATQARKTWVYYRVVGGFKSAGQAMRFEWYWKRKLNRKGQWIRNGSSLTDKINRMNELLQKPEFAMCRIVIPNGNNGPNDPQ